jgi:glutamate synthase domain-containing protein 2
MMHRNFFLFTAGSLEIVALLYGLWPPVLWTLLVLLPLILLGLYDMSQPHHSLRRNYPLFGRGRWFMEWLRPFIRQYLIESDTDGAPVNRMFRSIVYQRAKGALESVPFGTQIDTYRDGYEWIGHSLSAIDVTEVDHDLRVSIGGPECRQPYRGSIFNISAMSFGALSRNAILALNGGARAGGFYHNTGEGGTGAAPLEYTNSVGMPLREALAFVDDCLTGFGLRQRIRIISSGKVFTAFHLVKNLALGADICNSARGMMLALGCVQSLTCNSNHCPSGVATQDPRLYRGLVVTDKARRVTQFHAKTVHARRNHRLGGPVPYS